MADPKVEKRFIKDPEAVLDYEWYWGDWLPVGDTIAAASVAVPVGLTLDTESKTDTTVVARISGGSEGTSYIVTANITTVNGLQDDRSIAIDVEHR